MEFRKDIFANDNLHEIGQPTQRQDMLGHFTIALLRRSSLRENPAQLARACAHPLDRRFGCGTGAGRQAHHSRSRRAGQSARTTSRRSPPRLCATRSEPSLGLVATRAPAPPARAPASAPQRISHERPTPAAPCRIDARRAALLFRFRQQEALTMLPTAACAIFSASVCASMSC